MAVSAVAGLVSAIGAAAGGLTVFGLAATTLGGFAAAFALGAGLSMVSRALAPKPNIGAQMRGITQTTREPASSRKIIYGRMRVGGQVVFLSHSGEDNKYLHLAIAFASHEIQAYDEIWFNDNRIWTASGGFQGDWGTYVTIDRKFGTAGQSASTQLVNANSRWTTDHKLSGIAYIAFRLEWDQDKFPQGVPNITATIRGKKVYDPRTQTIAYSQNPALCVRDYMISEYGLDEVAANINDTSVSDAADLCDESITLSGGGTQNRYKCNGVIDTANQIKANIEQLLSSMGGRLTYSGGEYFIDGAEYKTPSHTFTEADVISDIQTQTKQSRRGIYNGVKGIFVSEEKNYKVLDYPAQISSTYEAEDGDPIYLDMPLPCVTNNTQAQRLAKIALLKSRQQVVMTLTVNLKGLNVKVGDTIQVTNDRLNYSSKVFEVIDYSLAITDGALAVNLSCIETASAIYDWTTSDEADFLSGGELPLYDGRTVENVTSLTMTEIGLRGPDGGVKSAVELSWTAPTDAFIEFYTVRYNKTGTTDYFEVQTRETNALLEGLDISSNYDFRVKAQNLIGVRSSGTSLTNQALNGDQTAPSAPTNGAATGGIQTITAEWSNPSDIDFKHVEVFVNTTNSIPASPTAVVDGEEYIVTGLSGAATRYFWLKSVDFSGNKSAATASFSGTSVVASSSDIGTGAVNSGQIADDAVNNDHLADDSVNTDQIVNNAVTTTTISDDAITTPKIATNAVTANEIAANTITASEIAANTITASEIASNTITASEIATDTITASEIAAGAIDTTELAADAVTTAKIAANAVTANEIAANTITASQIATDTITASEIAAGAINTTELAADAVTTAKIAANAVTATEINVTSLDDISADAGTITGGSVGGISITSTKLYAGTGDWANTNTGFYVDNTGKFSLKDKFFYNPSNNLLTVDGNITADVITAKENLVVLGDLEASSMAAGSITRAMFSQDALDEIYGALATSVGGSNGDYKDASGSFTSSGGTVTVGTSSDKFDHGTADVVVEFLANTYFYTTTDYSLAQAQATLNFEVSADGTFTDLTSATKTQTLQFGRYDLTSYYGYTYLVYFFNGEHNKTFTTGSGNDIPDSTELQFRIRVTGVGTAFTSQTIPFTVEANEGVTGVVSTGGNADTLDNLDSTKFLRSDVDDTFDANLTITGNLTVQGTQTTLNTATLNVEDKNIVLNYGTGDTSGSANGAGITIQDAVNSSTDATILWNATTDKFDFSHGIDVTGATTLDGYVYVNVAGNNLVLQSDSLQRETIQWTQNNVNRWKLNLQADGDLDFVPADTADKLLYNNNEIATQSWVTSQGYATSFSETDTLATVTGRGATTNTRLGIGTSASASYDLQIGEHLNISSGHLYVDGTVRINENGNATFNTISSGQITSTGSVTAGNASTSLGFYVGTTQVIQGSTRKLVNVTADANIITSGTIANARMPSYINSSDTRNTNTTPSGRDRGLYADFKTQSVIGLTAGGTYAGLLTFRSYGLGTDLTGGNPLQIAYGEDTTNDRPELYMRIGSSSSAWGDWQRIFADDYHPNADKWTTPRTLTLTGDVTGSVTWDGSGNATMTTTGGGASNDTLDDVTDRGATTTNNISVGGITASGPVSITGNGSYVGNYGYSTLVLQDSGGYAGLNFRHGSKNWLIRKNGVDDDLQFVYSDDASSQGTGTYTERFIIRHDGGFDLKSGALTSVGQITSSGSVTAGNASTSLGFYVGTTQVIQGSTRNLVNIGTIGSGAITSTGTSSFNNFRLTDSSKMGFGTVKAGGSVAHTASVDEGIFWHTDTSYGIYRTVGTWASPNYQQLKLDWPTGIVIDGGSSYGKSGVRIDSQLNVATASYEGSIVFGTNDTWHCGIRQHDDADAEMRIWHKNTAGMIFLATGYDGEPASISRPTDGLVVQGNNVGIGNFSTADPASKLHIKSTSDAQLRLDGDGTTWAGIHFSDNGGDDYLWYFGATDTWSFGGGGSSSNANKRIHVHGGMSIGATVQNTASPDNGVIVQGGILATSSYSGGSGDYMNITNAPLKISPTSSYWRIPHESNHSTVSGVYNYETGKDVYWGEPADTGYYIFRGRKIAINTDSTYLAQNTNSSLNLTTSYGYLDFGPMNSGYCHFQTDRAQYYFNKRLIVDEGVVGSYDENLVLQRASVSKITIHNTVTESHNTMFQIGGDSTNNAYNATSSTKLMFGGGNSDAQGNYYIGTNMENYGGNYTKLDLRWHTGIRMGAQAQYGGIRMYNNEDMGSLLFSVGKGDAHTRVESGDFYIYSGSLYMGTNQVLNSSRQTGTQIGMGIQHALVATNFGHGVYGTYSPTRYQHVWGMGTNYNLPANGLDENGAAGNFYGLAWTYNPNYSYSGSNPQAKAGLNHQLLLMMGGTTRTALGSGIWTEGNVTAYSDRRVKTNIEHIPNALEKVNALNGYTFDRTDQVVDEATGEKPEVRQTGVIAQEVLEVLPEAVTGTDEQGYSVAYGNMVGLLIEAIKEQTAQIESLNKRIEELENGNHKDD